MKFTREICRLLGLGGDGADEEEMEVPGGAPGQMHGEKDNCMSQDILSAEEGFSDEERTRRRAERRRAKRKRQKERKKLEREERMENAPEQEEEEEEEGGGAGMDSDSEEEVREETARTAASPRNKKAADSAPALVTTRNKSNQRPPHRSSEEEPEWDVSSAFVANAASHIRPKGPKSRAGLGSKENKENEARSSQVESSGPLKRRGASLTEQGIEMFKQGQYSQAVKMFTAAIYCDPKDHRFFGNRSYCYWCLERYSSALSDAQRSIQLAPDWPMGYFRKGSALMGLKRYGEAEEAMQQVLKLDQQCEEASSELFNCRVLQLMELGFEEVQSILLLEKFTTVQAALASSEAAKALNHTSHQDQSGSPCPSLWVGNVTLEISEKHIWDLFKTYGEIESIRVLHERFCAFVNFKNAAMAAKALEKLQGVELGSSKLVMRYPDRWIHRTSPSVQRSSPGLGPNAPGTQYSSAAAAAGSRRRMPINGDECFYWRTTGCFYGDKCRFRHIPDQRGIDKKPWQP
ncbi:hsp70-Hsp90 organizing protein 2-like [Myripristis murdjan]|uniref:hsp70-Hsp90 organizing protein 2-like n=1 Tax=Myripristis murdjan TaxID=586833 RepID=UPI001176343A|nr:hsp70-Hsp90 organizing protein 2-like [Myripristis murdjan]